MEVSRIEREIFVEATPDTVFTVITEPEHVRLWWPDKAEYVSAPGGSDRIGFAKDAGQISWEQFAVVDSDRPRRFAFRWTHPVGVAADPSNSFFVVFELEPFGTGTRVRLTETGFADRGWDSASVESAHADHVNGWNYFLARLPAYAESVEAAA